MSHITIIISKAVPPSVAGLPEQALDVSYEYRLPVPHDATPKRVGDMVSRAYRHLEGRLVSGTQEDADE